MVTISASKYMLAITFTIILEFPARIVAAHLLNVVANTVIAARAMATVAQAAAAAVATRLLFLILLQTHSSMPLLGKPVETAQERDSILELLFFKLSVRIHSSGLLALAMIAFFAHVTHETGRKFFTPSSKFD